jgi:membrane protease YdiL (CAAX protease family)
MTLRVLGLGKIFHTAERHRTGVAFWLANIVAAVLFGLGHLPATALLTPLTKLVVLRALLLNGIPGVVFGVLYFKRGLESAMVSYFAADLNTARGRTAALKAARTCRVPVPFNWHEIS